MILNKSITFPIQIQAKVRILMTDSNKLSSDEYAHYARHITLPDFGIEGQLRLKNSKVLCIGAGGLGCPSSMYLAAAGVGHIGIVDADVVEQSNLQRQIAHGMSDLGQSKVESLRKCLVNINPYIQVETFGEMLSNSNVMSLFKDYDLIIDGTDNFSTRYLINDACVLSKTPYIYASIFRFEGQVSVFGTENGPCYRCIFPEPPPPELVPNCAEGGVIGVLPGIAGCIQAAEAIKFLSNIGDPLIGKLLVFDSLPMEFRIFEIKKNPNCVICGENPQQTTLIDYPAFCGIGSADNIEIPSVDIIELKELIDGGEDFYLLDVREGFEYEICNLNGVNITLNELPKNIELIRSESPRKILVHCKTGGRSAKAVKLLMDSGVENVHNLDGGILEWIEKIDPTLTKY